MNSIINKAFSSSQDPLQQLPYSSLQPRLPNNASVNAACICLLPFALHWLRCASTLPTVVKSLLVMSSVITLCWIHEASFRSHLKSLRTAWPHPSSWNILFSWLHFLCYLSLKCFLTIPSSSIETPFGVALGFSSGPMFFFFMACSLLRESHPHVKHHPWFPKSDLQSRSQTSKQIYVWPTYLGDSHARNLGLSFLFIFSLASLINHHQG